MAAIADPAELVPLLRGVGLFSRCTDRDLAVVAKKVTLRSVAAGQLVVRRGDEGSELFLVLRGVAAARSDAGAGHRFEAGSSFGELAVLAPGPRASDVVAVTDCELAVLDRPDVTLLLGAIPGLAPAMLQGLAESFRAQLLVAP
ncbi:MAG: cyclic nucleotide-binding domain-containing protein [Ilumatobacteraceae bacterium]|jgi:CRP-like cAMP-binding protein|nr:cyclic nucleotide-binding domain-containing protein [Ilumatobacteraceae bacterium]